MAKTTKKKKTSKKDSKFVVFGNQKGGVGKSTLVELFAICMSRDLEVLVTDLDRQGSLRSLNENSDTLNFDYIWFEDKNKLQSIENHLKEAEGKYDLIIMDTPGKLDDDKPLNEQEIMRYVAYADFLVIPIEPTLFSLSGSIDFIKETLQFTAKYNPDLKLLITLNKAKPRQLLSREMAEALSDMQKEDNRIHFMETQVRQYNAFADIDMKSNYYNINGNAAQMNISAWAKELLSKINSL